MIQGMTTQVRRVRLTDPPQSTERDNPRKDKKKESRKVWRPSAISLELTEQICALLEKGIPIDAVCDYFGIDHKTFYDWKNKGETYLKHMETPMSAKDNWRPYAEFVLKIKEALATYRIGLTERLHQRGNKGWFRDLSILERRDRRNFGRREPFGGTMDNTPPPDEKFL